MAKDYARHRSPARSAATRRGRGGLPGWSWGLLGLALGLAVAALVWIGRSPKPVPQSAAAAPQAKNAPQKPIPLPPKQRSRFSFYELLPSYEVVIPREDAAASAKAGKPTTPEIAAPGQYLIQVGAYRTREEADSGRAKLALLGVESRVEQVTIDQTDTWYRVRIGPENSLEQAQEILERLDENGIKGLLIKVNSG